MAKVFQRVSLSVVWAWATHFIFPSNILRVLYGYFEHQRRVQFEGCVAAPLQTISSKWSCLLLRIVLQDALSEVTKIYHPLKLRIFVDDITALFKGENREIAEMAKKVMKKLKDVEEKGLKLSVTEHGKEGTSMMIASCGFLENELRQFSGEGVTLAFSVETLGVDLRTRVKMLGAKEKSRRKKCNVRFSLTNKNKAFQKSYMKVVVNKLLRAGMMPARAWGVHAVEMSLTERLKLRRQMAAAAAKGVRPPFLCLWKHTALKLSNFKRFRRGNK